MYLVYLFYLVYLLYLYLFYLSAEVNLCEFEVKFTSVRYLR
jgi:hypothetical protein